MHHLITRVAAHSSSVLNKKKMLPRYDAADAIAHHDTFSRVLLFMAQAGFDADVRLALLACKAAATHEFIWELLILKGNSCVHQAAASGNVSRLEWMLNRGGKLYAVDKDGATLLNAAGSAEVASYLLDAARGDARADLTTIDKKCRIPLHCAIERGQIGVVTALLDAGAQIDSRVGCAKGVTTDKGWTPLMLACKHGHVDIARLLLDRGCGAAKLFGYGKEDALAIACRTGPPEMVELLLLRGGYDVNAQRPATRMRPIEIACEAGREDVVRFLLAYPKIRATNIEGSCGETLLFYACGTDASASFLEFLLASGCGKVDSDAFMGTMPLMRAAELGHAEQVRCLLDAGADVNYRQLLGRTALECAAVGGHDVIVSLLLERGATVSVVSSPYRDTPRHVPADDPPTTDTSRLASSLARQNGHAALAGRLEALERAARDAGAAADASESGPSTAAQAALDVSPTTSGPADVSAASQPAGDSTA